MTDILFPSLAMPFAGTVIGAAAVFALRRALPGAVEPAAGAATLLLADTLLPWLPWLLSTAAGAMMYVVVEELIPESQNGSHSDSAVVAFAAGFVLMMLLELFC